jgi:hypothetical protein
MWSYNVVSPVDGKTYTGTMVGQPPSTGTTTIPTVVIPVRLNFQYNRVTVYSFDPTAADPGCLGGSNTGLSLTQASPVFQNSAYTLDGADLGITQYTDAFQRANFWSTVSSNLGYHTLLGGPTIAPLQTVTVSSSSFGSPAGTVYSVSGQRGTNTGNTNHAGYLGVMNINSWDPVAQSILTNLNIQGTQFPIFLFYNAVMSQGSPTNLNNCCILGYHTAVGSLTYAVAEFEGRNQTLFSGVADLHVSHCQEKNSSPDARYGGARKNQHIQDPQLATCASRRWFLPSQNRTSIYCLEPRRAFSED